MRALDAGSAGDAAGASGRRLAGAAGVTVGARVVGIVAGVITAPLLARTLGAGDFGTWVAALAYVGVFSAVCEFGLTAAATQRMAADPDREAAWLGALASLRSVLAVVALVACGASAPIVFGGGDATVVVLVLATTIVTSGAGTLMAVFQARLRPGIPVAIGVAQHLAWISLVVALSVLGAEVIGFAIAYVAMLVTIAVVQVLVTRRLAVTAWRDVRERWAGLLEIALPVGLAGLFVTVYFRVDAVLLHRLADPQEAGIYGAAYRFLDPLTYLPAAVLGAFLPVLAALRGTDDARFMRLVQRCVELLAVVALPALVITLILGAQLVDLLFGAEYARSATVLPILMGAFVAICFGTLAGYLAPVLGLRWRITAIAAAGATANLGLNVWLIPRYGAEGAAWVTLVTEWLTMACLLTACVRRLDAPLRPARIGLALLSAAVMGAAALAAEPLGLLPALIAAAVAYPAALLATSTIRPAELRGLLGRPAGGDR